jgi:pimeloyl-ACP methyl ester carboxylesterase
MTGKFQNPSLPGKGNVCSHAASLSAGLWLLLTSLGCSSWLQAIDNCPLPSNCHSCRATRTRSPADDARTAAFWASQHELAGSEASVDLYFHAAALSQSNLRWHTDSVPSEGQAAETRSIYHESVAGLIRTAQQFCRYDPVQGIRVQGAGGPVAVPISYHGFTWGPSDFSRLVIADPNIRTKLRQQYRCEGLGVPLIAIREKEDPERFHLPQSHFAATANLKTECQCNQCGQQTWTLELANPLVISCTSAGGRPTRLAGDLSATSRYLLGRTKRTYLTDFLRPGTSTAEAKLILLEPYQRGKIPLVFIHGLLSDPMTWADLYEAAKADPELRDRYQFWTFQYPTGDAFLRSASILRRELATAVACSDPDGTDTALPQMVLVGHSMGGLLSKLQITSSDDRIWSAFATRPFDAVQATPETREELQRIFFFEPSAHVRRVVFIGTPHNGAVMANRLIGRIGSYLVRVPEERKREYEALLSANPGLIRDFASKGIPTSVDMLEPDNPLLNALARLPVAPCVTTHSIIGTGGCGLCREPSDGVVPTASARVRGVESEILVDEDHEHLHHAPETIQEVLRILHRHLQCASSPPSP